MKNSKLENWCKILFRKWMEQSVVVGEKILCRKIDLKNSSLKINRKKLE